MRHSSTEHIVGWFRDRHRDGTLELRPPFQRRPVWTLRQKSALIESMLMGLPVPQIYMQQKTSPDGTTRWLVVDGQQRINAMLEFLGETDQPGFQLVDLEASSSWLDQTFDSLTDQEKEAFYGYRISVRMLDNASDEEVKDMFMRLNKYLTPLNRQELRNATYSGPFIRLSEALADDDYWAENRIVTAGEIRRMGDIKFVSDLMIGVMHGPQGGSENIIDEYYRQYEMDMPESVATRQLFNRTADIVREVLPDIKGTRWHNKSDFYTLFVATGHLLRHRRLPEDRFDALRRRLDRLEKEIDRLMADEEAKVPQLVVDYVGDVRRGTSDKGRRAGRHKAMLTAISRYFVERRQA